MAVGVLLAASLTYAVIEAPGVAGVLVSAGQVLPLLARRARPVAVFAVVAAVFAAHVLLVPAFLLADVALLTALHTLVTARGWRPGGWVATGVTTACFAAALGVWGAARGQGGPTTGAYVTPAVGILGAITATCLLAELTRARTQRLRMWQERAISAEREREQDAIIAAQAERARIAREIHDVVAHALVVVAMHAEGAQRAIHAGYPDDVEPALDTIATTTRGALAETRDLVRVLAVDTAPAPVGLEVLEPMVHSLRQAGRDVRLTRRGPGPPDLTAGHTAYRVIQEAVTNALKYAGRDATLRIVLDADGPEITVAVEDDGTDAAAQPVTFGPGNGLRGLRDRVEQGGGRFEAGPRPEGGFRVWAQIPCRAT